MRLSEIQGVLRDNMDASEVLFRKCPSLCEAWKDSVLSGQIWASAFGLATPVLVEDGRRDAASLEPAESQGVLPRKHPHKWSYSTLCAALEAKSRRCSGVHIRGDEYIGSIVRDSVLVGRARGQMGAQNVPIP
jgi:hypothetical protein